MRSSSGGNCLKATAYPALKANLCMKSLPRTLAAGAYNPCHICSVFLDNERGTLLARGSCF